MISLNVEWYNGRTGLNVSKYVYLDDDAIAEMVYDELLADRQTEIVAFLKESELKVTIE